MAAFYGTLQGNRSAVTRTGSRASGIKAAAQSFDGSVITELSYRTRSHVKLPLCTPEDDDEILMVRISTDASSSSLGRTIFYGTFDEYVKKLQA